MAHGRKASLGGSAMIEPQQFHMSGGTMLHDDQEIFLACGTQMYTIDHHGMAEDLTITRGSAGVVASVKMHSIVSWGSKIDITSHGQTTTMEKEGDTHLEYKTKSPRGTDFIFKGQAEPFGGANMSVEKADGTVVLTYHNMKNKISSSPSEMESLVQLNVDSLDWMVAGILAVGVVVEQKRGLVSSTVDAITG